MTVMKSLLAAAVVATAATVALSAQAQTLPTSGTAIG